MTGSEGRSGSPEPFAHGCVSARTVTVRRGGGNGRERLPYCPDPACVDRKMAAGYPALSDDGGSSLDVYSSRHDQHIALVCVSHRRNSDSSAGQISKPDDSYHRAVCARRWRRHAGASACGAHASQDERQRHRGKPRGRQRYNRWLACYAIATWMVTRCCSHRIRTRCRSW